MSRRRTIKKIIAWTMALVVGVPLVLYLSINIFATIRAGAERDRLEDLATERLADALPQAVAEHEQIGDQLGRTPDARWNQQVCDFDTDDGGWIVQNYREVCQLNTISLWTTDDVTEARALVAGLRGLEPEADSDDTPCSTLGALPPDTSLRFLPAGADLAEDSSCISQSAIYNGTKVLSGEVPEGTTSDGYLAVTTVLPLLDEDIGCVQWSVLFCDNPFGDEHAFGQAPQN